MTQALLPRSVYVHESDEQNSKEVGVAGFMVSRVPMGMARDSPVDETAVSEQSEECEGTTWLLKS